MNTLTPDLSTDGVLKFANRSAFAPVGKMRGARRAKVAALTPKLRCYGAAGADRSLTGGWDLADAECRDIGTTVL